MNPPQTTSYRLPEVCCRCGTRPGVTPIKLKSKHSEFRYYVVVSVISETTQTILVKVCEPCKRSLLFSRLKNFLVVVGVFSICCLVGAIVGATLPWLTKGSITYNWFAGTIIGIILGMFGGLGLAFLFYDRTSVELGTYDGTHFWFTNREFREQFGALNPSLIAGIPGQTRASSLNWQ